MSTKAIKFILPSTLTALPRTPRLRPIQKNQFPKLVLLRIEGLSFLHRALKEQTFFHRGRHNRIEYNHLQSLVFLIGPTKTRIQDFLIQCLEYLPPGQQHRRNDLETGFCILLRNKCRVIENFRNGKKSILCSFIQFSNILQKNTKAVQ